MFVVVTLCFGRVAELRAIAGPGLGALPVTVAMCCGSRTRSYVALVDGVHGLGGTTLTFSSLHVSGEQLGRLSGVAALLRFAVEDVDEAHGTAHHTACGLWPVRPFQCPYARLRFCFVFCFP